MRIKIKIEKPKFHLIPHTLKMVNNNQKKSALLKQHAHEIKVDSVNKGFVSAGKSTYKANHFCAEICGDNEMVVAYNTKKSALSMGFKCVSYNKFNMMMKNKVDEGLYEVLDEHTPRKLFFDVDFYDGDMDQYNQMKKDLFGVFSKEGINITDENVCEAGYQGLKKGKNFISYHIIVNNGVVFKNQAHLKNCMDTMGEKYPIIKNIIDMCVYNKFRNFRFPYQSKNGNNKVIQSCDMTLSVDNTCILYKGDMDSCVVAKDYGGSTPAEATSSSTRKSNNNLTHTNFADAFPKGFTWDVGKNDGSLEYIIKSIPNNKNVGYDVFQKIGMALYRVCHDKKLPQLDGLTLWYDWTKKYDSACDFSKLRGMWNSFNTEGFGMKTLLSYAKMFNKNFDIKKKQEHKMYDVPKNTFENEVVLESKYISQGCDFGSLLSNHRVSLVRSPMGSGKTWGARAILEGDHRICYVSCKRAFCSAIHTQIQPYGFVNYLDFEKGDKREIGKAKKILISIESLYSCADQYDFIFFDECETLFTNITGEMNVKNNAMGSLMKLTQILKNGKLVLMDAYLGKRTIDFTNEFMKTNNIKPAEVVFINNLFVNEERTYRECKDISINGTRFTKKQVFKSAIMKSIREGKKIAVCSGSRTLLEEVELEILKYDNELKYIFYNKKNPLPLGTNVNVAWDDIKVLMYSPTITAGISYDERDDHTPFDELFIYIGFSFNPLARDIIQAHKRVRKFTSSEIVVCVLNLENLIDYDQLPTDMEVIKKREKNFVEDLYKEGVYTLSEIESLKWVEGIYNNNILERNINDSSLPKVMEEFFEMENIKKVGNLTMEGFTDCVESVDHSNYNEIEDLSLLEFEIIDAKRQAREFDGITDAEWDQYKKAWFTNIKTDPNLTIDELKEYYDRNLVPNAEDFGNETKSNNIAWFLKGVAEESITKLKLEIAADYEEINDIPLEEVGVVELKETKHKKQQLCLEIFDRLNLYNTETKEIEIGKEFNTLDLEEMIGDFSKIRPSSINKMCVYQSFKNGNKDKNTFTLDNLKALVNAVMRDEFNMEISKPIKTNYYCEREEEKC